MTTPYATVEDLVAWLPADALSGGDTDRLLLAASRRVDAAVRAPYATDDDDLPTDDRVAAALRDATCAQVEFWLEVGEAADVDGLAGTTYSVPGYSGTRTPKLGPRALDALTSAGLTQIGGTRNGHHGGWWW